MSYRDKLIDAIKSGKNTVVDDTTIFQYRVPAVTATSSSDLQIQSPTYLIRTPPDPGQNMDEKGGSVTTALPEPALPDEKASLPPAASVPESHASVAQGQAAPNSAVTAPTVADAIKTPPVEAPDHVSEDNSQALVAPTPSGTPDCTSASREIVELAPVPDPTSRELVRPSPFEEMQNRTIANNAIANYHNSEERIGKIFAKNNENEAINRIRYELSLSQLVRLPNAMEVRADFPFHMFPEKANRLINAVASTRKADPVMAVPALLGMVFTLARGNFMVKVNSQRREALAEYFIVSGTSSKKKSPTVRFFREYMKQAEGVVNCKISSSGQKARLKFLENSINEMENDLDVRLNKLVIEHGDIDVAESLLRQEFDILDNRKSMARKKLSPLRLFTHIITAEKLFDDLECQGEASSIYESEGGFLKSPSDLLIEILLNAYFGDPLSYRTKNSGSVELIRPMLTICLYSQNIMGLLYGNEELIEKGLAGRFLPLFVQSMGVPSGGDSDDVPKDLCDWLEEKIDTLIRIRRPEGQQDERTFHDLELSESAKAEFDRYEHDVDAEKDYLESRENDSGGPDNLVPFLGKVAGHAIRLAGAVHLLKHSTPQDHEIDLDSMLAGIAMAEFFRKHAEMAFDREAQESIIYANRILESIREHPADRVIERDLQRGRSAHAHKIRSAVKLLEAHNYLRRYRTINGENICIIHPRA